MSQSLEELYEEGLYARTKARGADLAANVAQKVKNTGNRIKAVPGILGIGDMPENTIQSSSDAGVGAGASSLLKHHGSKLKSLSDKLLKSLYAVSQGGMAGNQPTYNALPKAVKKLTKIVDNIVNTPESDATATSTAPIKFETTLASAYDSIVEEGMWNNFWNKTKKVANTEFRPLERMKDVAGDISARSTAFSDKSEMTSNQVQGRQYLLQYGKRLEKAANDFIVDVKTVYGNKSTGALPATLEPQLGEFAQALEEIKAAYQSYDFD